MPVADAFLYSRDEFFATHSKMRLAARAALPLALAALTLMVVAGSRLLPYRLHGSHPVTLVLVLIGAALILMVKAYFCFHLPERAYLRWCEHRAYHDRVNTQLLSYVAAGKRTRGERAAETTGDGG